MADNATSQFPKMGEEPLTNSLVNVSGNRSPYTKTVARKGPSGDVLATGGKANRGATEIHEAHGPTFRPQTTICYPNAPEHAATGRGMRTVASAVGNRDFWDQRADGSGQVIG